MTASPIRVPLGGNAFLETPSAGGAVTAGGITNWHDPSSVFGIYVRLRAPASFDVSLRMLPQPAPAVVRLSFGSDSRLVRIEKGAEEFFVGRFTAVWSGYARFELTGVEREGNLFASPTELILGGMPEDNAESYVPVTERENYYWTRRGPSVHGSYDIRNMGDVEWFYNEAVVPEGFDPLGTYAMAIGFRGGYFGMQTNGPDVRKILFSVWSPHETDNPAEIPENRRVVCLAKGERTHVGVFGGEGSGGQSYIVHPWKTGVKQKFLVRIRPDGEGRTAFTAYYCFDDTGKFGLVASFLRPETSSWFAFPHSFLENFYDKNGWQPRQAIFSNAWAYTTEGKWIAPERILLSGDNTAKRAWRMDYDGGVREDGGFYLKNGGFFSRHAELGTVFTRRTDGMMPPAEKPEDLIRDAL